MKQARKTLKVGSSSDEFDYGTIDTNEIEIHPFQFKALPGAGRRNNEVQQGQCIDMVGLKQHRRTLLMNQNQATVEMKILTLKGSGTMTGSY